MVSLLLGSRAARNRHRHAPPQPLAKVYHGFTLVELLVVIAIISILAALLLPMLQKTVRTARELTCVNTFRQVNLALMGYIDEFNGRHPTGAHGYDGFASRYLWYYYGSQSRVEFQNVLHGPQRCPVHEPWWGCPYIPNRTPRGNPRAYFARQAGSDMNELLIRQKGDFPAYAEYAMLAGRPFASINAASELITYYHIIPRQYGWWWGQSEKYNPYETGPTPSSYLPAAGNFWNITSAALFWHADDEPGKGSLPTLHADGHAEQNEYRQFAEKYAAGSIRCKYKK